MFVRALVAGLLATTAFDCAAQTSAEDPDTRAAATERAMQPEERTTLTHGILALPLFPGLTIPAKAVPGAGYVAGVPRLGVPALTETDASLGVAWVGGIRRDGATALPSATAMGASWNPDLVRRGSTMIASEARAKGFNVMLAGGINLMRDPRNGRTFEYFGEDPLLSGLLGGAAVTGIQSRHVISTVKHFALNAQETGRHFVNGRIGDDALRMSDLLAFEIAIEVGQPGSVMCAYNQVNGAPACGIDYLLNRVLKNDWGYKGFVMSDWGAVASLGDALAGLDQQSGAQLDRQVFFAKPLAKAAASDPRYALRLSDMNRRVLRSIYAIGLDRFPPAKGTIDVEANAQVARAVADEGIVLLRNRGNVLPLAKTARSIAIIGGYADSGVLSGGGSSQVQGEHGPVVAIPVAPDSPFAALVAQSYHRSSPLKAIKAQAPAADITYRDGRYLTDAVSAARRADVAIVFATQPMTEGFDVADLSLPNGQDALISAVATANPNTIVVIESGGPIAMPWLDKTAAVLEAWYPGARGGEAIAGILFGDVNPSGRLPITFPKDLSQLPRPALPGADVIEPNFAGAGKPGQAYDIDYTIEGADVGYRWFARQDRTPLFAFGFGLSYTTFEQRGLSLAGGIALKAQFEVNNSGSRSGSDVGQLYLVSTPTGRTLRLAGFAKLALAPGESKTASIAIDPRVIAERRQGAWNIAPGRYGFALGRSANDLGSTVYVNLPARRWR